MDLSYQSSQHHSSWVHNVLSILLIVSYGGVLVQFLTYTTEIVCIILVFIILARNKIRIHFPDGFVYFYITIILLCLLSSVATGTSITKYISFFYRPVFAILIINAFLYDTDLLKLSMAKALKFICKLALIGFVIMPFVHDNLPLMTSSSGFIVRTLGFIINTAPYTSPYIDFIFPIYRNQGVFTEPGLLGIVANIYLYLLLFEYKYNIKHCWLPVITIITAFSTTGFLILGAQLLIWGLIYVSRNKKSRIKSIAWVCLSLLLVLPLVYSEVNKKFTREGGSGREYDTFMAFEVARNNPVIGIGPDKEKYLAETRNYQVIVNDQIRSEERGNSNGLIALFIWMGIPIALLFLYGLYKQKMFDSSPKVFFIILVMAFLGEPNILNDFIFLILVSSLLKKKRQVVLTNS